MARKHDILYVNFYTDGSAARKIAPAFPESRPQPKPRTHKQKKILVRIDPVAIVGIVTAIILVAVMAFGMLRLHAVQSEVAAMNDYILQLEMENGIMEQRYQEAYEPAQVEKTVVALGMVPVEQVEHINLGH